MFLSTFLSKHLVGRGSGGSTDLQYKSSSLVEDVGFEGPLKIIDVVHSIMMIRHHNSCL